MPDATSSPPTAPALQDPTALLKAARQQIIGLLLLLTSVTLMVAPWIAGYPDTAKDAHRNELGIAIVVFLIALLRFARYPSARPDLFVLVAGVWLAVSPWALSAQKTTVFDGAQVADLVIGSLYVLLSLTSLGMLWRIRTRLSRHRADA
ncbi:SPW repeat protein [Streptomyces sp. NPDC051636]|uniref:SPW repeat domain-containing protein n=1 Tax=Streptomyces sp. NPDC051636 TaxID=3365663 RepID=UPI0037B5735E